MLLKCCSKVRIWEGTRQSVAEGPVQPEAHSLWQQSLGSLPLQRLSHWPRHISLVTVVWCGVMGCGEVWCGVMWCGVLWRGVVWCGVAWCVLAWFGVVWCDVMWCGVAWCGVVWRGVV